VFGLIGALAQRALRRFDGGFLHHQLARCVERGLAPDHRDLVLLEEIADAIVQSLHDAARTLHHGLEVERDFFRRQAIVLGVLHQMKYLRRAQQRLGRDASPVVADAAEIGLLDDSGLEAKLRRADRGDVAAGARADDDDVEGGVGHVTCSFSSWRRSTVHSRHCEEPLRRSNPPLSLRKWIASLRSQ